MRHDGWNKARRTELLLRLASAAFLIPFGLYVVWSGGFVAAAGASMLAAVMAYEWVRMTYSPAMKYLTVLAAIPAWVAYFLGLAFGWIALLVCAVVAGFAHPLVRERFKSGFGVLYGAAMPLAVYTLRVEESWNGLIAALGVMVIVWASDTGAFFTGRTFGGPPLYHASPSKTWSGAFGGVVLSALTAAAIAGLTDRNVTDWAIVGIVVSVFAQAGDMFESMVKRRLGVKDASKLLPGHGGVMDRVDGLGAAAAVAVIALTAWPELIALLGLGA